MQKTGSGFWCSSDLEWYKPVIRGSIILKELSRFWTHRYERVDRLFLRTNFLFFYPTWVNVTVFKASDKISLALLSTSANRPAFAISTAAQQASLCTSDWFWKLTHRNLSTRTVYLVFCCALQITIKNQSPGRLGSAAEH